MDKLEKLSNALLEKEVLDGEEVKKITGITRESSSEEKEIIA